MIQLTFYLEPVGKARARTVRNKYTGKVVSYTPDKTAYAESLIKAQAMSWLNKKGVRSFPLFERGLPLRMAVTFVRSRPKSLPKRVTLPTSKPDCDNYIKLTLDSLRGIIFSDDAQVVSMLLEKEYVKIDGVPRIEFCIWEALPGDRSVKEIKRR